MSQHFNNDAERLSAIKKARLLTSILLLLIVSIIGTLMYLLITNK